MTKLHLEKAYLDIVKEILKKNISSKTVIAFGSRVTGKYKPHSDLDICVLGKTPLTLLELANLHEDFSESSLPFRVDIVDWSSISAEFQNIIKSNSMVIQIKNNNYSS
jgi:predicted nucleotidyltransferase